MTTVFFSWQSDRDSRTGRNLIERALEIAISNLKRDITVFEADRDIDSLTIDRDTRNMPGSPPIVETIFKKIDSASVFVPDLTFVGSRIDKRPTPNPNVLIEYGWALRALGHGRIVAVMNTAHGTPSGENLPFDLRHHRHPITYHCPPDASDAVKTTAKNALAKSLESALKSVFESRDFRNLPSVSSYDRLHLLLEQVNKGRISRIFPSHVAQGIGEQRVEEVQDWFRGKKEPSFEQLSAIASLFGINEEWLHHGEGSIYFVDHLQVPEDPFQAVDWLTDWGHDSDALNRLHLIRSDDETGNFYIVKESDKGRFQTYYTPIHVSECIGASGESALAHLFITLELLYRCRTRRHVQIYGYLMNAEQITYLTKGAINPSVVLSNGGNSTWWEDIWDEKMFTKNSYWEGWHSLCERIDGAIQSRNYLLEQRIKIRTGNIN